MLYIAYLDEFGHEGPFVARDHPRHKTSPVFGLGGLVLPSHRVRSFATFFYQLKCNLLATEIRALGVEPFRWEKKGSALFTTRNISQYPELRRATNRILNRIGNDGGMVFYVGIAKTHPPEEHNPKRLFRAILREAIKRLDQFCSRTSSQFLLVLDEKERAFRSEIVEEASIQMFGFPNRSTLLEPPIQAESHLFQTLQCADWVCGLIGRLACYRVLPAEFHDFSWADTYFGSRIRSVAPTSGIRYEG